MTIYCLNLMFDVMNRYTEARAQVVGGDAIELKFPINIF